MKREGLLPPPLFLLYPVCVRALGAGDQAQSFVQAGQALYG